MGAMLLVTAASAQAQDRIWTGIVLASQADKPIAPPPELAEVAKKMEAFFGYNQIEMIGSATKLFDDKDEHWLVPSQHFWVSAKGHKAKEGDYVLRLILFHDKQPIVETEAKLGPNSPLLIRGPMHARGQIVIVFQVLR
jgi:hypothetical protein